MKILLSMLSIGTLASNTVSATNTINSKTSKHSIAEPGDDVWRSINISGEAAISREGKDISIDKDIHKEVDEYKSISWANVIANAKNIAIIGTFKFNTYENPVQHSWINLSLHKKDTGFREWEGRITHYAPTTTGLQLTTMLVGLYAIYNQPEECETLCVYSIFSAQVWGSGFQCEMSCEINDARFINYQ